MALLERKQGASYELKLRKCMNMPLSEDVQYETEM